MVLKNRIIIDTRRVGKVNSTIYGFNIEHIPGLVYGAIFDEGNPLSNEMGFRKDVIDACKRIKVPLLRWPGGNFASGYNWLDGIGPRDDRPTRYDLAWRAEETNRFGTDEFIEFCRLIGAEPYITVNAGSETAVEAAHWVEYCNLKGDTYYARLREEHGHPEPYNVKYWSIGNEMWGDFQIGHLPAEEYARKAREYAKLMRRVDPNINLTCVGHTLGAGPEWNLTVLKTLPDMIEYLSVHQYYHRLLGGNKEEDYYRVLACPIHAEKRLMIVKSTIEVALAFYESSMRMFPPVRKREIGIAFDEWNISGCHTLRDALGICRLLNVFQRLSNSLKIGCMFPLVHFHEHPRRKGREYYGSPITTYKNTLVLEAGYHAFDLYANHTGEVTIDSYVESETYDLEFKIDGRNISFKNIPYLDSSATISKDGKVIYIATVNAHLDEMECIIELRGCSLQKTGRVFELNARDVDEYNDREYKDRVKVMEKPRIRIDQTFSYVFPAHSATVIQIPTI